MKIDRRGDFLVHATSHSRFYAVIVVWSTGGNPNQTKLSLYVTLSSPLAIGARCPSEIQLSESNTDTFNINHNSNT